MNKKKEITFKVFCKPCNKKHIMILQDCPDCGGRSGQQIPIPKSEKVYEKCKALDYCCDGCDAYKDHLR